MEHGKPINRAGTQTSLGAEHNLFFPWVLPTIQARSPALGDAPGKAHTGPPQLGANEQPNRLTRCESAAQGWEMHTPMSRIFRPQWSMPGTRHDCMPTRFLSLHLIRRRVPELPGISSTRKNSEWHSCMTY